MACAAAFCLAPWAPLYYPLLLAVAALSWYRLDLAVLLVPLFVPFFLEPKHLALTLHAEKEFPPAEIFLVLDVGLGLGRAALRRTRLDWESVRRSPFIAPAILLLVAGTLSTLTAEDRHHALEWYRWTILEPVAFYALLLALDLPPVRWQLLLGAVVGAGVLASSLALLHVDVPIPAPPPGAEQQLPRIRGPYGSADNLGLLLDRVLPLVLALSLFWLRRWIAPAIILIPALALSFSRGAWAAVFVGCLLVFGLARSWGRRLVLGFLAAILLAGVIGGPLAIHALQTGHAHTVERRLDIWRSAVAMIRDHPVLGIGPDNFIRYYAPTRKENLWQRLCPPGKGYIQPDAGAEPCLSHPHNVVLDFWLSTGVLGLLAFLWLQVVFWRTALRSRDRAGAAGRALAIGSLGAMLASLGHGLVDESYFLPDLAVIFWLLCACVASLVPAGSVDPSCDSAAPPTGVEPAQDPSMRKQLSMWRRNRD